MDKNNALLRTGQDETLPDVMDMFTKLCDIFYLKKYADVSDFRPRFPRVWNHSLTFNINFALDKIPGLYGDFSDKLDYTKKIYI